MLYKYILLHYLISYHIILYHITLGTGKVWAYLHVCPGPEHKKQFFRTAPEVGVLYRCLDPAGVSKHETAFFLCSDCLVHS